MFVRRSPGVQISWKEMWAMVGQGVSNDEGLSGDLQDMPKKIPIDKTRKSCLV